MQPDHGREAATAADRIEHGEAASRLYPGRLLRVCMVISSYHPIVGGAEKQVAQLAQIMSAQGHDVQIVTRRYPGLARRETIDGIEVHRAAAPEPKPIGSLSFVLGAAKAIRGLRPDIIHCHSLFTPSLAGLVGKRLTRRPLIVKPMCGGEATSILRKPLGARRIGQLARQADRLVAVSSEIARELLAVGIPREKICRIPNGVDTQRFHPSRSSGEKADLRARLGLPAGTLFIFAGRIAKQKRLPLLLQAWPAVRARAPDATLLIAGANRRTPTDVQVTAGEAEDVPSNLFGQPGIRALGHIDDMPSYLRASDIFVLPSAREGLSNALLEACASGIAIVAADIGGAEDFIVDGRNGLLFSADDQSKLSEAMASLALDPILRARLGDAVASTVRNEHDIRATAERLLVLYTELIAAKSRPDASTTADGAIA